MHRRSQDASSSSAVLCIVVGRLTPSLYECNLRRSSMRWGVHHKRQHCGVSSSFLTGFLCRVGAPLATRSDAYDMRIQIITLPAMIWGGVLMPGSGTCIPSTLHNKYTLSVVHLSTWRQPVPTLWYSYLPGTPVSVHWTCSFRAYIVHAHLEAPALPGGLPLCVLLGHSSSIQAFNNSCSLTPTH